MILYIFLAIYFSIIIGTLIYTPIRKGIREEKGIKISWQEQDAYEELLIFIFVWPVYLLALLVFGPFFAIYYGLVELGKYIAKKSGK